MDADAELHRLGRAALRVVPRHRRLDRDRTRRRIDRTGEIGDDAVAGGVEDAPAMLGDQPVDQFPAGFQPGEGAGLVGPISRL